MGWKTGKTPWEGNPMTSLAGSVKTFSCPSCGGTVTIRAAGISITAICSSCGSLIDIANDNFTIIREAAVKTRNMPIPLGRRATFFGVVWEVIGYCERCDSSEMYQWREYLLFNPYQGFRFLTEADGQWNFVTMLRDDVEEGLIDNMLVYKGKTYQLYVRGEAIVTYVMGEFYWRVKVHEKTTVADYIAPPYLLSMEKSAEDVVWSRAEYVTEEEVVLAFGTPLVTLSHQTGIAPNQPSPHAMLLGRCKMPFFITFSIIMIIQMIFVSHAANKVIYERIVPLQNAVRGQAIVADSLEIPGENGNLEFSVYAPVNNNWLELTTSLVNESTQESEEFIHTVEYYYGRDSDGAWSEGSQISRSIISAVPGGKYSLLIEGDSGKWSAGDINIRITRDVPTWGIFLLAFGLISIYPLWVLLRHWNFECKRWQDSDYAPTAYRRNKNTE